MVPAILINLFRCPGVPALRFIELGNSDRRIGALEVLLRNCPVEKSSKVFDELIGCTGRVGPFVSARLSQGPKRKRVKIFHIKSQANNLTL
jgi:hypothetical protein